MLSCPARKHQHNRGRSPNGGHARSLRKQWQTTDETAEAASSAERGPAGQITMTQTLVVVPTPIEHTPEDVTQGAAHPRGLSGIRCNWLRLTRWVWSLAGGKQDEH